MELVNRRAQQATRWLLLTERALPARRPAEHVRFQFSTAFLAVSTPQRPIWSMAVVSPPAPSISTMILPLAAATPALLQVRTVSIALLSMPVSPAMFPLSSSTADAKLQSLLDTSTFLEWRRPALEIAPPVR